MTWRPLTADAERYSAETAAECRALAVIPADLVATWWGTGSYDDDDPGGWDWEDRNHGQDRPGFDVLCGRHKQHSIRSTSCDSFDQVRAKLAAPATWCPRCAEAEPEPALADAEQMELAL
jgi:hypothetical protein